MTIPAKPPMGQREPRPAPDPDYIAGLHDLPCCICEAHGEAQLSPTTAHHTICGRGSMRKTPDRQAIPLCDGHHQGKYDVSKVAIHHARKAWVEKYGLDTDYIAATQDRMENDTSRYY